MADEILNAIIQLENQIEQQLQAEQVRAAAWLAEVRREQEAEIDQVRQELQETSQQRLAEAEQKAERQAEDVLQHEMEYCRRLEEFSDQELLEVLRRQLVRLLPRRVDDHQNG